MSGVGPADAQHLSEPFDQESWDRWKARGRVRHLAMRRKVRVAAIAFAVLVAAGTTLWWW